MSGMNELEDVSPERLVHLTSTGRRTGMAHVVWLWFAVKDGRYTLVTKAKRLTG